MDNQTCDRHPSAQAKARVLLPNLGVLYFCAHCANGFQSRYDGEFHISYEVVSVNA